MYSVYTTNQGKNMNHLESQTVKGGSNFTMTIITTGMVLALLTYIFGTGLEKLQTQKQLTEGVKVLSVVTKNSIGQTQEVGLDTIKKNEFIESVQSHDDIITLIYKKDDSIDESIRGTKIDFSPLRDNHGIIVKWTCHVQGSDIDKNNKQIQDFLCENKKI